MKYSVNPGRISSFVVGRTGSEYGLPMAVIKTVSFNIWSGPYLIKIDKEEQGEHMNIKIYYCTS